jgi:hypothetical protein
MNTTKFIKKNKIFVILIAVVILIVIFVPSFYYGLKKSNKSLSTNTSSSHLYIHKTIDNDESFITNTSNIDTNNIYIKFNNLLTYDLQNEINNYSITKNIFELIKFINKNDNTLIFSEIINSNERKLSITYPHMYGSKQTINVNHDSYYHANQYIDIELYILKAPTHYPSAEYIYRVYQTNSKGVKTIFFTSKGKLDYWEPIKNIIINKNPYTNIQYKNELERQPISTFILKTDINTFPVSS